VSKKKAAQYLLGIDIGTSCTKALLCTTGGEIVQEQSAGHPLYSPKPGWNEQNPQDWWTATKKSVRSLVKNAGIKDGELLAIGLSGQMHGSVFLDSRCRSVRNALLWNDQRTQRECEEITERVGGRKRLLQVANNIALTGYTAPKILWLRRVEPRQYEKVRKILLPKDYIRFCLTGEFASDVADASGTLLLDIRKRTWNSNLLSRLDIDKELLPLLYESSEVTGVLGNSAARELGLTPGITVVAGAGDQAAGAVGMGIVKAGMVSATIGTSGVIFAHADTVAPNPDGILQSFCHAVAGKWCVFGTMLSAGGSLEWLRQALFEDDKSPHVFEKMMAKAETVAPGSRNLVFLPYLDGERCPHPDPFARACWIGLSREHDRASMTRAVIEGITFGMTDQILKMRSLGISMSEVRCAGGGSKSRFWRQLQADCYQAKTVTVDTENASAFGAALLAGVGAGVWDSVEEACENTVHVKEKLRPQKKWMNFYRKRHAVFQNLYDALEPSFPMVTGHSVDF
jgi:xylulokinase